MKNVPLAALLREGAKALFMAICSYWAVTMDIADRVFVTNRDWDSHYLRELVTQDLYDFSEH